MDLPVFQRIAHELDELLPGGFVNKIHQPLPRDLVLRIRPRVGLENKLMLSADPGLPRMHLTNLKIPNPSVPPRFCAFLRAHFQGSRIVQVKVDDHDRVVRFIATRGPEGQRIQRELIVELLGRDSNIILVESATNLIMDCLHRIPAKKTGNRAVMPGVEYAPPPRKRIVVPAAEEPTSTYSNEKSGIGTVNGKDRLVLHASGPSDRAFPSMNLAADAFYRPKLQSAMLEAYRRNAIAPLKARVRSLERRIEKIRADGERLERLTARQIDGELLKANLRSARKGMEMLEVQDWETGGTRTIYLNPALSPVENMEQIFKKCAKGKRGGQKVQERRRQTLEELRALSDILYFMDHAADVDELDQLVSQMRSVEVTETKHSSRQKKASGKEESQPFHTFPLTQNRQILVGKSAAGNEFILRRKARKGDLWLHTKDFSGAHVLLPASGQGGVSTHEIEYAAALAVRYSKARGKGKVEVMTAKIEDVATVRGGIKGQVTVKHYTTVLSDGEFALETAD